MFLESLTVNKIRPFIQFKEGKYYCRYRNSQKNKDLEFASANFDETLKWRSRQITDFGSIQAKGPSAITKSKRQKKETGISASSPLKIYITFWLKFIENIPKKPGKSTIACLKHMLGYDLVRVPVNKLDYNRLAEYIKQRSQSPSKPSSSTLSIDLSSIIRVIRDVNTAVNIQFEDELIVNARNLLFKNGLVAASGQKDRRLEKGEWELLLKGLYATKKSENLRIGYTLMFQLYISTALRCSELLSLTWRDIDFAASSFKVVILKQKGIRRDKLHTIPMLDETKNIFLRLRPEKYKLDEPIFHVRTSTMSSAFTKAAANAGIEGLTLHDLRTEGITRMLELGISAEYVSKFTGHRDLTMITKIYSSIKVENINKNIQLIIELHKNYPLFGMAKLNSIAQSISLELLR